MAAIVVKQFGGLKPIVSARLLATSEAQVASNVKLVSGSLLPLKGTTTLQALQSSSPATIYRYGTSSTETNYWLEFSQDTDIIRSPIAQDQYDRLYWTNGNDVPRYAPNSLILQSGTGAYPRASYQLGIPAPTAPTLSGTTAPADKDVPETRAYLVTYVSAYGEEGPPSPASNLVTVKPGTNVTVGLPGAPSGSYNITLMRIYRSSAVGNTAQWQFVAEVPVATSSYDDLKAQSDLGEVLPSTNWYAPPAGLKGLRVMANGAAVGFVGKTLYFSEPNLPHAWPHQYPIDYDIVGIATYGQYVAVLTTSYPYLFQGVDPAAMSSSKLTLPQACVSKRSIIETGNGVIYASPDGLVEIGTQNDVITKGLFNREQWQAYQPSSIQSYVYNGRIHCFYNNGTKGVLVFDFTGQGATFTTSDINSVTAVTAGFYDATTDKLYLAQGSNIVRFDSGYSLPYTWKSKQFRLDYPTNFGFAQVNAYQYPVTLKVYADGVMKSAKVVYDNNQFRLPSGFRAYEWAFQVEGTGEVIEVTIAQSTDEMKSA
jgi:hypothetical protein